MKITVLAIRRFLELLTGKEVIAEPVEALEVVREDESDDRYLECAVDVNDSVAS